LFVFPSQYEITRVKAVGKCILGSGSFAWHDGASTIFGSFSYGLSRNLSCEIPQITGPCFAPKSIGQNEPNFLSNSRNTCIDTAMPANGRPICEPGSRGVARAAAPQSGASPRRGVKPLRPPQFLLLIRVRKIGLDPIMSECCTAHIVPWRWSSQ
jgi:hypothetical protein